MARHRKRSKAPSSNWTRKELQQYIREHTEYVQERIKYHSGKETGQYLKRDVKSLQKLGTGKTRKDDKLYMGLNKNKDALIKQARKLSNVGKKIHEIEENYPRITPQGKYFKFENEQTERAYQTFQSHWGKLTRKEYRKLLDAFGAINDYLESFGYERDAKPGTDGKAINNDIVGNLTDLYKKYSKQQIKRAMQVVILDSGGKGWTPTDMMEHVNMYLENPIEYEKQEAERRRKDRE